MITKRAGSAVACRRRAARAGAGTARASRRDDRERTRRPHRHAAEPRRGPAPSIGSRCSLRVSACRRRLRRERAVRRARAVRATAAPLQVEEVLDGLGVRVAVGERRAGSTWPRSWPARRCGRGRTLVTAFGLRVRRGDDGRHARAVDVIAARGRLPDRVRGRSSRARSRRAAGRGRSSRRARRRCRSSSVRGHAGEFSTALTIW